MSSRPTISDVARLVGISPSTVSRALTSDNGRVAAGTRAKIIATAREIGYTPNRAAQELITGRSNSIGFVIPDIQNPYFASILKGVQIESQMENFSVFVADSDEDPKVEFNLVNKFIKQVDGLILCSSRISDESVEHFARQTSVVLVNRQLTDIPSITMDEAHVIRLAIEHLYALGHRHIAYASGPESSWTNKQRLMSMQSVEQSLDDLRITVFGPFNPVFSSGAAAGDLAVASGATALVACNDLVAMGAMTRFRQRAISVPEQMSVVGIDDSTTASIVSPTLTSVHTPTVQLGRTAVNAIIDVLKGDHPPATLGTSDIGLRVRESTTMAPAAIPAISTRLA